MLWERSDWPTIPQLYVNGEFVGGCDILLNSAYLILLRVRCLVDESYPSAPIWGTG